MNIKIKNAKIIQVFIGIGAPQKNPDHAVQIGVIVPVAFVQQKQVPIRQDEQSAGELESVAQGNAQGTEPHDRVDYDHPG